MNDVPASSPTSEATDNNSQQLSPDTLDPKVLQPLVSEAIHRLSLLGFQENQLNALRSVNIKIADLPGWTLATTTNDGIAIDQDAAGHGWFIDQTPSDDAEFSKDDGQLIATEGSPAENKIDLLTVLAHEFGHYLGLADTPVIDASSLPDSPSLINVLMQGGIRPGIRRIEAQADLTDSALVSNIILTDAPVIEANLTITPTIRWNSDADGFWDVASNWIDTQTNLSRLPTATDDIQIDRGAANPTITVRSGTQVGHSLLSSESLVISGGSLDLGSDSEIDAGFTLSGGTLQGSGTLTLTGGSTWSGGTMSGTGATTFNGALAISGSNTHDLSTRTLNLNVTTTWTNVNTGNLGQIRVGTGAIINNAGLFLDQIATSTSINNTFFGGAATFNNVAGETYRKSGAVTTTISITFNNTGTIDMQSGAGTLQLANGGTSSGTFTGAAGTTIELSGGTHTLATGINLLGRLLLSGGTTIVNNTVDLGGLLEISTGTLTVNGTINAGSYTQSGGTLQGTGTLAVSSASTWSGGTMSGTGVTTFNGALAISTGNIHDLNQRTLNLNGTTTWTNANTSNIGRIRTGSGATINNAGLFLDQIAFATTIDNGLGGAASTFNNLAGGTYRKSGTVITTISELFNNSGTIIVENAATLSLSGTFANFGAGTLVGGTYNLAGTLQFNNAAITTLAANLILNGSGAAIINQSNVNALTALATIASAGSLTLRGGRDFTTAGSFQNQGTLALESGSIFSVSNNYTQSATASLSISLAGTIAGLNTGELAVAQNANLDGALNISYTGGFLPSLGDSFAVVIYTSRSGTFASISGIAPGNGVVLKPSYNASNFVLFTDTAPANLPPIAVNDLVLTSQNVPITFNVLTNDSDPDRNPVFVSTFTNPAHGQLIAGQNGSFTFTPTANFNGSDSFTYTIQDGQGGQATATVFITISAVVPGNLTPVAGNDTVTTNEDTPVTFNVLGNDSDPDGDPLTVSLFSSPSHGSVVIGQSGNVTYKPAANFNGSDSFVYRIQDGRGGVANGTVSITINPVPDNPIANNDSAVTALNQPVIISVLANDTDPDGGVLSIFGFTQGAHGSVLDNGNGTLTYTPVANFTGADAFQYTVQNATATATATVFVSVTQPIDVIPPQTLPPAQAGTTYFQTVPIARGAVVSFTVLKGSLPPGLSFTIVPGSSQSILSDGVNGGVVTALTLSSLAVTGTATQAGTGIQC